MLLVGQKRNDSFDIQIENDKETTIETDKDTTIETDKDTTIETDKDTINICGDGYFLPDDDNSFKK